MPRRAYRPKRERIAHRFLERRAEIRQRPSGRDAVLPYVSEHRGLQAAEGEVECRARAAREPARKVDLLRIAGARELVDVRPARVRQTEQLGHFVESLARGVVESVAESTVLARRPDLVQRSVASGDDESEPGRRR